MDKVRFIAISGTTRVTQNLYVYEYLPDGKEVSDMILVDCGVGFPEEATYGVDLVIPDFTYLVRNKQKIRGLFVSHGHEDHYGAVPFLLRQLDVPIYASRLTLGFIQDKLTEYGIGRARLTTISADGGQVKLGPFTIDAFHVTHSVPDSLGFCITTPLGALFHVPDYKFDWTPVDQRPFDIARAAKLAQNGVLALASDALGATSQGYTQSELELEKTIEIIIESAKRRVFFTTISSNISRMRQAINASARAGRKVVLIGRSIEKKMELATDLGIFKYPQNVMVSIKEGNRLAPEKVTYLISGCYGQVGSSLYRLAMGEHQTLKIDKNDMVIFSADPAPPGTEETVNFVVDNLVERGAEVHYYDTQEDLHVSGHGSQKEIEMLLALIRPRYMIPIGGTIRHMRAYSLIAQQMGWAANAVFELRPGEVVEFTRDSARRGLAIPVRYVLVDGLGVGDVGNVVLRDRKTLAQEGIVIASLQIDRATGALVGKPDLISRGFVFGREQQPLLDTAATTVLGQLRKPKVHGQIKIREVVVDTLERFFFAQTGRRPMIVPVIIEV